MKFHCDSCNARYSIPDERVRGKVLKIRCKSCSAVITVREDEEPQVLETPERPSGPAITDVDWYMSVDGEQTGPMKLAVASAWLVKQAPDVEIYCWYDGFGDWKSVREVAAFAAVRPSPPPRAQPASSPRQPSARQPSLPRPQTRPSAESLQPGGVRAETVIPSFRSPSYPAAGNTSPSQPAIAGTRPSAPGALPAPAPTIVPTLRPSVPKAAAPAPLASPPAQRPESTPGPRPGPPAEPPVGRTRPSSTGPTGPMTAPVQRRVPLVAPPSIPPMPLPEPAMPTGLASPAGPARPAGARPAPAAGPLTPPVGLAKPTIEPADPDLSYRPRAAASSPSELFPGNDGTRKHDDMELEIEEPSRVISLDMLRAQRRNSPGAAMLGPALPGMGRELAGDAPETPSARADDDPALLGSESAPVLAPPRRRSSMAVILATVSILVVAAGALAFVVLGDSKDESETSVAGSQVSGDFENLGFQIDRPDLGPGDQRTGVETRPDDSTSDKGSSTRPDKRNGSGSTSRRPDDGGRMDPDDKNGKAAQADAGAQASNTGPLSPLSPDEVIRQSDRSQISFKRCYERAKKKDPFLEVRSLNINLKVDTAGEVTDVKLDKMDDSYLGECLKATVKRWKLPASTEGISSQISLVFER